MLRVSRRPLCCVFFYTKNCAGLLQNFREAPRGAGKVLFLPAAKRPEWLTAPLPPTPDIMVSETSSTTILVLRVLSHTHMFEALIEDYSS